MQGTTRLMLADNHPRTNIPYNWQESTRTTTSVDNDSLAALGRRHMKTRFRLLANKLSLAIIYGLAALCVTITANAATVRQVGISDMLVESALVIHGHVTERWTEAGKSPEDIFTHVRIAIDDVIKGTHADESIVLKFLGGTLGRLTLTVSDMNIPIVGEEGIYFVERTDRVQVNPLYGWQQGHLVVRYSEDGADKLVMTHDLRHIFAVEPAWHSMSVELSRGVALGLATDSPAGGQPLTVDAFKEQLKNIAGVL